MKKVILYMITLPFVGGAQSNVLELIKWFHQEYDVHLATSQEGALTSMAKELGVNIHLLPSLSRSINLIKDVKAIWETVNLISIIKPDLIHLHSSKAGLVGRIAGKICAVPTIFTVHGWGFAPGTPIVRKTIALISEKLTEKLATKLICVAESDRILALRLGIAKEEQLITIRNGISGDVFPLSNPGKQPPRLLMVARFSEQKDQVTLIKAIAQLKEQAIHLDLVGSGSLLANCQQLAANLKISDRISFLGDRYDVVNLLAGAQIFLLISHYEGLPISILEAMRAGLPVIATNVNGIPEQVSHEKTGLLVPPKDVNTLAQTILKLIQSPQLRQAMGEAAREKFLEEFTKEKMLDRIANLYREILQYSVKSSHRD
jgi:glycosyltransferase involved in cell wall biosynthesis